MKLLKNQSAFSLVEILIALALAAGLSVVLMNLAEQSSKQNVTAMSNMDVQEVVAQFNTVFSNRTYCENTLGPLKLGSNINTLRFSEDASLPAFAVAGEQFKKTRVQIKEMLLVKYADSGESLDPATGELNIHFKVTFEKLAKNVIGGKQVTKTWTPRVQMGELYNDPGGTCTEAKMACQARTNGVVLKVDTNEPANPDPADDDGCSSMTDEVTGEIYYQVNCYVPATTSTVDNAVIIKCLI